MKLLYDMKLKRPGCVLLAAVYRADRFATNKFPSETWLTSPTPDMRVYECTPDDLQAAIKLTKANFKREGGAK